MEFASKWQETLHDIWDENWDSDKKLDRVKARAAAMCSGAIDGAVIIYPFMLVSLYVARAKIKKLEERK